MAVRRLLAAFVLMLAFPAVTAATTTAGKLHVVAWSATTTKAGLPPADAVAGGLYCTKKPISKVYAFVRFTGMRDKVPSTATWLFNKKKVFVFKFRWEDGDIGRTAFDLFRSKGALAEGVYGIKISSGGVLVGAGAVRLKFGGC
jgi:hypothetical protein